MFSIDDLPRKRMAAGALIRDAQGCILIVKPTYRSDWLVPGGSIEADESPFQGAVREIEEELGLQLKVGRLLCIEYQSQRPNRSENLQFIFDGGTMNEMMIAQIVLPKDELSEFRFVPPEEAMSLLADRLNRRIALSMQSLAEGKTLYAENGTLLG